MNEDEFNEDWISVKITDDGIIITDRGQATEDAGKTWRKATEEEIKWFKYEEQT